MPRNVRNFWITAKVDGRVSKVIGGPQAKEGGFSLLIKQRNDGAIIDAAQITGTATPDGRIILEIEPLAGDGGLTVETKR